MLARQRLAVDLVDHQRLFRHRLLERERVAVGVCGVHQHLDRALLWSRRCDHVPQPHSPPVRVAEQPGPDLVADAHQGRFLVDLLELMEVLEIVGVRRCNMTADFQPPDVAIDIWVHDVLGH